MANDAMSGVMNEAIVADANATGDLDNLIARVREAVATKTPLSIHGGATKTWYGHRVEGVALDVRAHAGIVDYEPSELVIVARAGTSLQDIEALLDEHHQMLAFEPPHFAARSAAPVSRVVAERSDATIDTIARALAASRRGATLGGCIAAGLSGPRRVSAGAVRDFVLGARVIDGKGQHLSFGGRVMKNVAGYDVSRALAGSLGTLGVITEVSLKVLPRPVHTTTLRFTMTQQAALDKLNAWAGMPVAITASAWRPEAGDALDGRHKGTLMVRLEGSESAVLSGIRRIGGLDVEEDEAVAYWTGLREQTDAFFTSHATDVPLWRIALPSVAPTLDSASLAFDNQLIEWGGALRWIATKADAEVIRKTAASLGGHAALWRASDAMKAEVGVFSPISAPLMAIHSRLKTEFDPNRLFNRGRMYPEI